MRVASQTARGWGHCVLVCLVLLNSVGSGSAQLEDVSATYAINASTGDGFLGCGLSCADFNGDGWDDLTLSEGDGDVQLHAGGPDGMEFVGNLSGEGTPTGVLWVDIEEDGDLDLWVMRSGGFIQLFVQDGDGTLSEEAELRGVPQIEGLMPRGCSASDYDRDGDLDVYVANYIIPGPGAHANLLLQNDGSGHFVDVADSAGVGNGVQTSFQGSWLDHDDDGWDDLWVINDRAPFDNALYRNQGDGTFVDVAQDLGVAYSPDPMSATVFDPDQDGDWDLFATDVPNLPHQLWVATDTGYVQMAAEAGVDAVGDYGWGACVIDIDGQGREDLMVATNLWPEEPPTDNRVFMNGDSGLGFTLDSSAWPNEQYPLYHLGRLDFDGDRSPDVAGHGPLNSVQMLRTTNAEGASRLALRLVGTVSNSHAVGARIKVHAGGAVQMQQVDAGTDYQTQHSYTRFFGLGASETIDSIEVRWPAGLTEVWRDVDSDAAITLIEGTADAALTALDAVCPWGAQGWLLPFSAAEVAMTWNGEPVTSDTVWADVSGEFTLEASWWSGRFVWSQSVQAVVPDPPVLAVQVHAPACWGDSAWVEWTAPDSGSVFIGEMDVTDLPGWAAHETDVTTIQWVQHPGCGLDTVVVVEFPDSANVAWTIQSPACAGETGQAIPALSGGTPPWSADWAGLDPDALPAGVHAVVLTDSLGCSLYDAVEIESPDSMVVDVSWFHAGLSDTAQVDLQVTGGNPPFSVLWTGGLGDGMLISPDLIGWLVEDAEGCIEFGTVEVPSNPLLNVGETSPLSQCFRDESGLYFTEESVWIQAVDIFDVTGRLLYSGRPDAQGRIALTHVGLVVVRMMDKAGTVWTTLR